MPSRGPRTAVTIQPPSDTDLAYLAGVVDGEGHIKVSATHGMGIVLCMADIPILEWCHERFSGRMSGFWTNEKANARPRKMWHLTRAADLAYLLPMLIPFLVLKRLEAEILLEAATHSLAASRTPEWRAKRAALVEARRDAMNARK